MALTLVGITTLQRGCELAETGINLSGFDVTYSPQFKDKRNNFQGQVIGFALPTLASRKVSIKGDWTSAASGVMLYTFIAASVPANDIAEFGGATGGLYMDDAQVGQSADGFRSVSINLSSDPLLA